MLAALIRNLIYNALQYTPPGGRIDVGVYREAEQVILQIEDTGPGILPTDLDRIFEPFVRGGGPSDDGTGLELSGEIVKRIVDRLAGSVALENISGAGSSGLRATVQLPAADRLAKSEEAPRSGPAEPKPEPTGPGTREVGEPTKQQSLGRKGQEPTLAAS